MFITLVQVFLLFITLVQVFLLFITLVQVFLLFIEIYAAVFFSSVNRISKILFFSDIWGTQSDYQKQSPDVAQPDINLWKFQRNVLSPDHMTSDPRIQNATAGL